MSKELKIGLIIADEMEFVPLREYANNLADLRELDIFGYKGLGFTLQNGERSISVEALLCGIGKVNAATTAAYLCSRGADYVINFGLSGGISGVSKDDIVLGSFYVETDFDLTPLGLKPAEKPGQEYIYKADEKLLSVYNAVCPRAKTGGLSTGDVFVSSEGLKKTLSEGFGVMACEMESAAAASVCHRAGVGFLSFRQISDDAGEEAADEYTQLNDLATDTLLQIALKGLETILSDNLIDN